MEISSNPEKDEGPRTASAVEEMSDDEGAWAAYEITDEVLSDIDWFEEAIREDNGMPGLIELSKSEDEDNDEMPGLEEVSDSEDEEGDGMDLEEDDDNDEMLELVELSESKDEMDILLVVEEVSDEEDGAFEDASGEAFVSTESTPTTGTTELYDSGCTNHISPYKNQFQNAEETIPRHFRAANKQSFSAVGKGDLVIDIPNNSKTSQLWLTDVLYLPEVSYTLVSIGRLDEKGFTVTFGGGKCILVGLDGVKVGEVLRKSSRIYKVEHEEEEEMAGVAEEKLNRSSTQIYTLWEAVLL